MIARNVISLILVFAITNCDKRNYASDETVISDVLPELIKSLGIRMSNQVPPPPPLIYDKDTNFIPIDAIEWEKQLMSRDIDLQRENSVVSVTYWIFFGSAYEYSHFLKKVCVSGQLFHL